MQSVILLLAGLFTMLKMQLTAYDADYIIIQRIKTFYNQYPCFMCNHDNP